MSLRTDQGSAGPQKGRAGLMQSAIPSVISSSWKYLRNVGSSSGVLGEDGSAPLGAPRIGVSAEDNKRKEQVSWASFDNLDVSPPSSIRVLLLTYQNGFQAWDVHEAGDVRELVSRRDGPVACLRVLPQPLVAEPEDSPLHGTRPLLAVVAGGEGFRGFDREQDGSDLRAAVRLYSLQSHSYVHALRFRTPVLGVQASRRLVAVALSAQIYCFDAASLQNTFSVLTYPAPQLAPGVHQPQQGAMALNQQWLGYAANQPLITPTGRVSPQCLSTPSPSPSTSPAQTGAAHLVAHYAKESGKQLAAGVITLGDMGYKTLNNYVKELMQAEGPATANGGPTFHALMAPPGIPNEQEYAGTVIIRDVVTRNVVAQFRAHTSPLSALAFDPSGTLVVTASICGHSLNVFQITPQSKVANTSSLGSNGETHFTAHLYRLHRGLTNAVIQDIRFSSDSEWVAVSTTRGTTHMYAVSRLGGHVGPSTHVRSPDRGQPPAATWQSPNSSPPGVTLSVVARIRNSNGGWRGSVTGAAAAATGRANMISGAVATSFHSGKSKIAPEERAAGFLEEQLYVLSPNGYLLRYWLRPYIGSESSSANAPEVLKLAIEPRERWDVCRRVSWVEREERVAYRTDGVNGLLLGEESGAVERGVQTGDESKMENGGSSNGHVALAEKRFDQRPPRPCNGASLKDPNLCAPNDGLSANIALGCGPKEDPCADSKQPSEQNGPFGGQWEGLGQKSDLQKGPWASSGKPAVANGVHQGQSAHHLLDGDLFDDENSEGSFEVSHPSSPPSSFESPRYLLQKHFASSPLTGAFLTPAMLNSQPVRTAVPSLDLDSEGSTPTNAPSSSGGSLNSTPSPRSSPARPSSKSSPDSFKRGAGKAAATSPSKQPNGDVFGFAAYKQDSGSAPKDAENENLSPKRTRERGLNGLHLNGLTFGEGRPLKKADDSKEGEESAHSSGFLSPIPQIAKEEDAGQILPGQDADGSSKSFLKKHISQGEAEQSGKANKKDGKLGEDKGGVLGGLRDLMSSGAQGLAAAVTAVGGAPPRESLLDQDVSTPVDKSAKVYQHPIPVGDRKKVAPRNARRIPVSKPRVTGGSRGLSPAGSRGVSPVGSPGGLDCFKGGSPGDRCVTPGLLDKRGKLLRNRERVLSSENLHQHEEGPVYTGAVAEANAESENGDNARDNKESRVENSTDGWEQQGFLEGFSFSEDGKASARYLIARPFVR